MPADPDWLIPDWPAPATVRAVSTTRAGGASRGPWAGLNLADHVEDDPAAVTANRRHRAAALQLPGAPAWLQQVHGTGVVNADAVTAPVVADGTFATRPGAVCVVMTADCLPVLLCNRAGTRVAAVHAGWRGLAAGVIEAAMDCFDEPTGALMAWLGPAIGPRHFEVGDEVRAQFLAHAAAANSAFESSGAAWRADIYELARQRLAARGLTRVFGGGLCTFSDAARFYSYRRDGVTGRMATLIWLQS